MPVQVSYPGVYVQEAPSGVISISGVATSVAAFVGMAPSGPVNVPTRVLSFRDFEKQFGGDAKVGELPLQVRQFFMNGGGQAWIVRTMQGATSPEDFMASSTLKNEFKANVLTIIARDAGEDGNMIRVEIDYDTASPERTFNLTVFREIFVNGEAERLDVETFAELTMQSGAMRYAVDVLNAESTLVSARDVAAPPTPGENFSIAGRIFNGAVADQVAAAFDSLLPAQSRFVIRAGGRTAQISLEPSATDAALIAQIEEKANSQLAGITTIGVSVEQLAVAPGGVDYDYLEISSTDVPIEIVSAPQNDIAAAMQMGVANGGLEFDSWSNLRPAPNGYATRLHNTMGPFPRLQRFATTPSDEFATWSIAGGRTLTGATGATGTDPIAADAAATIPGTVGSFENVRTALRTMANAIETADADNDFDVELHGHRLVIYPRFGGVQGDRLLTVTTDATGYSFQDTGGLGDTVRQPNNVARYAIGIDFPPDTPSAQSYSYRDFGQTGSNGLAPLPADYRDSFDALERADGPFNILVLPRALEQDDEARDALWGAASAFCETQRAFLLVDPHRSDGTAAWTEVNEAVSGAKAMRSGVVTDHAALYWPRIKTMDDKGKETIIDPAGTMAGVFAKTDTDRGVWKAPAGLGAPLIGVRGLEYVVTNEENGLTNPEALNTLRMLSSGATSWGARTMIGYPGAADQDYKYVPIRRLALMIASSLEIGLGFAVFEPNGETLWGQIRMAAGAFMNGLFRDGAFKGESAQDAYYVACGPDTTSQTDINLGIVNVEVGFAPLKPAEFVVVTIRQIVGQIDT